MIMSEHLSDQNVDQNVSYHSEARSSELAEQLKRISDLERQLAVAEQCTHAALIRVSELEAQLGMRGALQNREAGERMAALLEVCSALLVTHEVAAILQLIVYEAPRLFPGTTRALLFLVDPDTQHLILRAASGDKVTYVSIAPGEGMIGQTLLSPRAMLVTGPQVQIGLEAMDASQIDQMKEILDPWPPSTLLLAPLRFETQRLGALVLCSGTHAHLFHPRDLPFIQTLADLTTVAISEVQQRQQAAALRRDLAQIQSLHEEAQARLSTAQAQLLQSAKLAAVGELAASVAHEINNPLYAARNSLYLVEQDLPGDAPQRPFLDIAQTELGRIARIITRMRDFYRPTRAELAPTNVNKILMETVELVQTHLRHNQIHVTSILASELPLSIAHADQLRQVFLNLMLNACDAMPDGGDLYVSTEHFPAVGEHIAHVVISIRDTGIGIAVEHLPHLFEPFYTTKPQGTGLGLAISAHIITQHDGQIQVETSLGIGTTFSITLPVIVQ